MCIRARAEKGVRKEAKMQNPGSCPSAQCGSEAERVEEH